MRFTRLSWCKRLNIWTSPRNSLFPCIPFLSSCFTATTCIAKNLWFNISGNQKKKKNRWEGESNWVGTVPSASPARFPEESLDTPSRSRPLPGGTPGGNSSWQLLARGKWNSEIWCLLGRHFRRSSSCYDHLQAFVSCHLKHTEKPRTEMNSSPAVPLAGLCFFRSQSSSEVKIPHLSSTDITYRIVILCSTRLCSQITQLRRPSFRERAANSLGI